MARIQTPQHVQELQAEFKVREPFGLELLETIQPTVDVATQKVASQGYPRKCFGRLSVGAGGAGTNVECAIECPTDVGIVILLTKVNISDVGGTVELRAFSGTALGSTTGDSTQKHFRDSRINPAQRPDGALRGTDPLTAAPNGDRIALIEVPAGVTVFIEPDVILGGGGYWLVRQSTANAVLAVGFEWTEFLLEDR